MTEKVVLIFTLCIYLAFELFIIYRNFRDKKYGLLLENAILSGAAVLLFVYNSRLRFPIRGFILIFFVLTLLGHTLIGELYGAYHKNKYYDRFLHGFGSFSFALLAYSVTENILGPVQSPKAYIPVFVAAVGISVGVIFELVEFMMDSLQKKAKSSKHQHGLADTDFDLISDLIGSVLAGIVSVYVFR